MNKKICPVCGSVMHAVETLRGKLNTSNVVKNFRKEVRRENLIFYLCPSCTHGAIDNVLDHEFYTGFTVALGGGIWRQTIKGLHSLNP